jgi:hypothetical protein
MVVAGVERVPGVFMRLRSFRLAGIKKHRAPPCHLRETIPRQVLVFCRMMS